jgi:SSS family solute:Na+ symporter
MPDGGLFTDATGHFSVHWAILIAGAIIIIYTMMGGLWAVLMTDVLQFIILNMAVLFVIPLIWTQAGGFEGFTGNAPEGFFNVVQEDKFTWFFMLGWVLIHFFKIGAEWAFAQRFICVPTAKDAKKSTYLFGVLYLVSPIFWLLPPMIYRTINPNAEPEQAYILACQAVLPLGMLGLMVAAMFSATASMVSSQLNVFAGVLTDLFHGHRAKISQTQLLRIGRYYTVALGVFLTGIALAVPYLGGAEQVILSVTKLMVGPLLAPTIWGLVSKRVTTKAVWLTAGICFVLGVILKLILNLEGTIVDISIGVILPVVILTIMHCLKKETSTGWKKVETYQADHQAKCQEVSRASSLPALIVSICIALCGIIMFALIPFNPAQSTSILCIFGGLLLFISLVIFIFYKRKKIQ